MLPESLDLKKLRAFQLAARHGSIRTAASRLHLTVAAVSFQIKHLEQDLGVTLFERFPNRLALTPLGHNFLREAEAIFERVEAAIGAFATTSVGGRLSISAGSDIAWYLTPLIANFIKSFPAVELSHHVFTATEAIARLRNGKLDLGVGFFPAENEFQRVPIFQTSLSVAWGHGRGPFKRRPVRLKDVADQNLVLLPKQSATRKLIDRAFARAELRPRRIIEAGTCEIARQFAEQGAGVAILHSRCLQHHGHAELPSVDLEPIFGLIEYSALFRKASPSSTALQALVKNIVNYSF